MPPIGIRIMVRVASAQNNVSQDGKEVADAASENEDVPDCVTVSPVQGEEDDSDGIAKTAGQDPSDAAET